MKALDVISRVAMPQQIAEIARPIALRHHVNELYLFGSMARGEGHTVKKRYITTELQDRLAEMQRVIFVNSITSNPMFRII